LPILHTEFITYSIGIIEVYTTFVRVCNSIERIIWYNNIIYELKKSASSKMGVEFRSDWKRFSRSDIIYIIIILYTLLALQLRVESRTRIIHDPAAPGSWHVSSKFHVKEIVRFQHNIYMNRVSDSNGHGPVAPKTIFVL